MPFIHTLRLVTPTVLTLLGSTFFTPFTSMTAAELVSEPFAYSASIGGLANKNGGVGWTAAWDAGANNTVATGLTYISGADTLLVSGGSADIISDPTTISSFRALPAAQSTGSVWISFLTSVERFGNGYAGLSLFNGGTEQLFIGQRDSQTVWGIEGNSVNSNSTSSTQSTTFLLVRLDMKAGNDDVFLWTNPALAAQPSDASATQLLAFGNLDFNRLRFECGNNSGAFHVDELRCGKT